MEISQKENPEIFQFIECKFKEEGITLPIGENPLAIAHSTEDKEFIRLYINDSKIVIFPNKDEIYWKIKETILEYEKKYKEMSEKQLSGENLLDIITPEAKADMERIWFTADLHHGHDRIVGFANRPTTPEKQEEWLINDVWNRYIKKKDRVYVLGDLSMANRKDAEKFISKLNGQKFLILGNHDNNIHNSPAFAQISQIKDFNYSQFGLNLHIVLCHYPMLSWNRSVHGSWHLYGHVHGRLKHPGLAMDVGIDNSDFEGHRPLNLYQICEFMSVFMKRNKIMK